MANEIILNELSIVDLSAYYTILGRMVDSARVNALTPSRPTKEAQQEFNRCVRLMSMVRREINNRLDRFVIKDEVSE